MANDVTCSQCGEKTDAPELRSDSIGYLDDHQADVLAPLGPVTDVIQHLIQLGDTADQTLAADITSAAELPDRIEDVTLPMLFDFWWNATHRDTIEPCMLAAKRIVQTAMYRATLMGKGCPYCHFDHQGTGRHRERTIADLVIGGVTDDDPILYFTPEELTHG